MKYCQACGTQIPDDAVFCPSCGKKVFVDPWARTPNEGSQNNNASQSSTKTFDSEYCQSNNYRQTNTTVNTNTDNYSPLTIAGVVLAFLASLIGLILSICAYNEAKRTGSEKNKSLSKTGIIIASVFLGLEVLSVILIIALTVAGVIAAGSVLL
ncbi:MAG: zinc-ribbon domain-containing protein [Candidatus Coproplasma sp.]